MKHVFQIVAFMFILTGNGIAQTDIEKAHSKALDAVELMDNGHIDEAIALLEESRKLDPNNINYPYEIALANYIKEDYQAAAVILEKLLNHKNVIDRIYQLLGNCYDMMDKKTEAINTYNQGLELFPNSGILYLERGNMEMMTGKYNEALYYYEKGIEADPGFSSNYYWASRIYCNSSEEVWGLIYGELFMNIERNSARTAEISKLLFDTFKNQITFNSDSSYKVSFSQNADLLVEDLNDTTTRKLPFGILVYEPLMTMSLLHENSITLASINRIRTQFVFLYFKASYNTKYPNILFDFQKTLADSGYLEAYNYWVFMKGDEEAFSLWHNENKDKWNQFRNWFSENPLKIDLDYRFYRKQY